MNLKNAIIDKVSTMKDGSLKITLVTRELHPQEIAELFFNLNSEVVSIDIPEETGDNKTPSQRFRNVLFRLWEQSQKEKFKTFTLYYNHIMEQLIGVYKDKLS